MNENFCCGKRIKELRTERALSQEQLALMAGITPVYLGQVERGLKNATVVIVEKLCNAMNVSLAEFFSVAESCPPISDDIGKQILHQLTGLSNTEKNLVLQIVKNSLQLRRLSLQTADYCNK